MLLTASDETDKSKRFSGEGRAVTGRGRILAIPVHWQNWLLSIFFLLLFPLSLLLLVAV